MDELVGSILSRSFIVSSPGHPRVPERHCIYPSLLRVSGTLCQSHILYTSWYTMGEVGNMMHVTFQDFSMVHNKNRGYPFLDQSVLGIWCYHLFFKWPIGTRWVIRLILHRLPSFSQHAFPGTHFRLRGSESPDQLYFSNSLCCDIERTDLYWRLPIQGRASQFPYRDCWITSSQLDPGTCWRHQVNPTATEVTDGKLIEQYAHHELKDFFFLHSQVKDYREIETSTNVPLGIRVVHWAKAALLWI